MSAGSDSVSADAASADAASANTASANTASANTASANTASANTASANTASDPDQSPVSDSGRTGSFIRSYCGRIWLAALVIVPLLIGLIGYAVFDRSRQAGGGEPVLAQPAPTPDESGTAAAPESAPDSVLAPLSIIRRGNEISLTGDVPDMAAKRKLVAAVIATIDDVSLADSLNVVPGVRALDFSAAAPVFDAATLIRDFTLDVAPPDAAGADTVILGGTAVKSADVEAVVDAAEQAWPTVNIVNRLEISSLISPTTLQSTAPERTDRTGVPGDTVGADTPPRWEPRQPAR